MPRTTPGDVIDLLGSNYDNINCPSMKPYIKTANLVTTRVVNCIESAGEEFSDDEAQQMEMWLAAYFYTIGDPIYKSKQTGNSQAEYFDRSYLDGALALDPTSCLKSQIQGTNATMFWLGKTEEDQIDFPDRTTD